MKKIKKSFFKSYSFNFYIKFKYFFNLDISKNNRNIKKLEDIKKKLKKKLKKKQKYKTKIS